MSLTVLPILLFFIHLLNWIVLPTISFYRTGTVITVQAVKVQQSQSSLAVRVQVHWAFIPPTLTSAIHLHSSGAQWQANGYNT